MLPKKHRLAKSKDISLVYSRGRAFFNPYFTLKFLRRPQGESRLTVVVSTKVSKKAVVRNRIKRVLREYFRLNVQRLQPGDYLVTVKTPVLKLASPELRNAAAQLLTKIGLYK